MMKVAGVADHEETALTLHDKAEPGEGPSLRTLPAEVLAEASQLSAWRMVKMLPAAVVVEVAVPEAGRALVPKVVTAAKATTVAAVAVQAQMPF